MKNKNPLELAKIAVLQSCCDDYNPEDTDFVFVEKKLELIYDEDFCEKFAHSILLAKKLHQKEDIELLKFFVLTYKSSSPDYLKIKIANYLLLSEIDELLYVQGLRPRDSVCVFDTYIYVFDTDFFITEKKYSEIVRKFKRGEK